MRIFLLLSLCLMAPPVLGWTFTPGLPCRLSHETPEVAVELTFDPNGPLYTITLTRPAPWPEAPVFSMRYFGPFGRTISTDQHQRSADGRSLSVSDSGFGNVISGLIQDQAFSAQTGDTAVTVPLDGAAAPATAFAGCRPAAGA